MTGTGRQVLVRPDAAREIAALLASEAAATRRAAGPLAWDPEEPHLADRIWTVADATSDVAQRLDELVAAVERADAAPSPWRHAGAFLGGAWDGLSASATAAWDHVAVWRGEDWLATWAQDVEGLTTAARLLVTDPAAFAELVLDLELLGQDPARWAGERAADVAAGRALRLGRDLGAGAGARSAEATQDLARYAKATSDEIVGHHRAVRRYLDSFVDAPLGSFQQLLADHPALTRFSLLARTDGLITAVRRARPRHGGGPDLIAMEGAGPRGARGHTIARHVARSDDELRSRLETLGAASTFDSLAEAQRVVDGATAALGGRIDDWLAEGRTDVLTLTHVAQAEFGRVLLRGRAAPIATNRVRLQLHRDPRWPGGYRIERSYPLPPRRSRPPAQTARRPHDSRDHDDERDPREARTDQTMAATTT